MTSGRSMRVPFSSRGGGSIVSRPSTAPGHVATQFFGSSLALNCAIVYTRPVWRRRAVVARPPSRCRTFRGQGTARTVSVIGAASAVLSVGENGSLIRQSSWPTESASGSTLRRSGRTRRGSRASARSCGSMSQPTERLSTSAKGSMPRGVRPRGYGPLATELARRSSARCVRGRSFAQPPVLRVRQRSGFRRITPTTHGRLTFVGSVRCATARNTTSQSNVSVAA